MIFRCLGFNCESFYLRQGVTDSRRRRRRIIPSCRGALHLPQTRVAYVKDEPRRERCGQPAGRLRQVSEDEQNRVRTRLSKWSPSLSTENPTTVDRVRDASMLSPSR